METAKKKRVRSPNFPSIGLPEAIQRITSVYREQRQYPTNRETIARLMGYRGLNGASAQTVSALSKYGLLEGQADDLRVSDLGQDLALHRLGDPEFAAAVRKAALEPAFFQELSSQYPSGLPSEHALHTALIKRGFLDTAIDGAIESYRLTMDLVSEAQAALDPEKGASVIPSSEFVQGNDPKQSPGQSGTLKAISLPMSGSTWAELRGPFPVSKKEWSQMMAILQAMEPALVQEDESNLPNPLA
jgi:hypothetical protein